MCHAHRSLCLTHRCERADFLHDPCELFANLGSLVYADVLVFQHCYFGASLALLRKTLRKTTTAAFNHFLNECRCSTFRRNSELSHVDVCRSTSSSQRCGDPGASVQISMSLSFAVTASMTSLDRPLQCWMLVALLIKRS